MDAIFNGLFKIKLLRLAGKGRLDTFLRPYSRNNNWLCRVICISVITDSDPEVYFGSKGRSLLNFI